MARKERIYICKQCGKEFLSTKKEPKSCSKKCQYDSMRGETFTIKCELCGKEFETQNVKRKFCSLDCNNKSIGINKLKNPNKPNTICSCCKKEFYLSECRLPKNNEQRYCSIKCHHKDGVRVAIIKNSEINNIPNMKEWLFQKYSKENKTFREIAKILNLNNGRSINQWLTLYNIPIKHGSEAIDSQWIGEKGKKRKISSSGELSTLWNPNKTLKQRHDDRKIYGNIQWVKSVLGRDWYTCRITGIKGKGDLVVHHLDGYDKDIENRFNIENGITVLESIHKLFHHYYGYGKNTKAQFEEFTQRFDKHEFDIKGVI